MARAIKPSDVEKSRNMRTGIRTRNSRVKRNSSPYFTHRQIFLIIVMLIIFMGSGISYVWSSFEGTQIGYDLSRLQQKELRLKELNRKLKLELATLKSPQNLEEAASALGLKEALPEQIVILP
ncbi:MAG: cell division protein FtsL [Deltaproteobacteria bacterium]|nr:cell division protein FtsL [Deltaproteobacteria bacterium]